jgi:hypothetical protein
MEEGGFERIWKVDVRKPDHFDMRTTASFLKFDLRTSRDENAVRQKDIVMDIG